MAQTQSDPTGLPNSQLSERAKFTAFIGLIAFLAGIMAYLTLPTFLQPRLCPPTTVWCKSSGSTGIIVCGMLLIYAAAFVLLVRYGTRFPKNQPPQPRRPPSAIFVLRHGQVAAIVAVLSGISGLIWVNYLESYYCVTTDRILLSTGLFNPSQMSSWSDVTVVRAECGHGRGDFPWSDLRLTLSDGTIVTLPLRARSLRQDYDIARAALVGKHYKYRVSETVVPNLCPPAVYPLLADWGSG